MLDNTTATFSIIHTKWSTLVDQIKVVKGQTNKKLQINCPIVYTHGVDQTAALVDDDVRQTGLEFLLHVIGVHLLQLGPLKRIHTEEG